MEKPILINFIMIVRILDMVYLPFHVLIRAFATKKKFPKKINQFVNNYKNEKLPKEYKIIFTLWKDGFSLLLNAKAVPPNYILVSPEWATKLLLYNNEATQNAFLITLGHEITHNEGDFPDINYQKNDKRFINWVNEVHADFGGAEKMGSSNRNKLIASIVYKRSFKKKKKWNKDYSTHPSWNKREEYVTNYNFDEILIKKIATEAGCMNQTLIDKVIDYYKPIILE